MLAWQVPYLGWRHFPAELSEFEISRFFTFKPEVHRAIRSRYKDTLRLGVALQLGFLTMCGRTLHAFQRVPAELLKHLGEQMEIAAPDIATLRALYKNRRATLFEHQAWSIEFLGFMRFEMTDAPNILPALRDVVKAGVNGDPLLASARRLLHEYRFVIPGTRRLGSLVQLALQSVEREVLAEIDRKIPLHIRTQWLEALYSTQPGSEATLLEWLREPPGNFSPSSIERQAKKVKQLLDLLVDQYLVATLTPEYMHGYAEGMRLRRPSRFAQLKEPRRTIELVSFMQFTLFENTDLLVKLIDRQVARIWSRASKEAKVVTGSTAPADAFVSGVREVLSRDTLDADGKITRITTLLATLDASTGWRTVAARQRQILVGQISQIRPLVEILLDLDLCADSVDWWPPLLKAWRNAYRCPWLPLTQDTCPPTSRAWKELLADPDLRRSRNAAEAQLLWELRQALRRGSLFIPHSLDYRSPDALFNLEGTTVRAPGSARAAPEFLEQLCAHLEVALENLDEAIWFQDLKIDGTKIHQHPLGPQITPIDLDPVRDNLYDSLPKIHLPELLLEVDAQIRFSWILLGREPASDDELLYIYVALLGHAMDLSAPRMQLMTPRLSVTGIDDALHLLEEPVSLRRANEAVIEFMQSHPMAVNWGDLGDCAADAMSLDASRHIWLARTDPKRRTFSTATYVHTLARHGIVYDQPLAVTQRQQGAAIEGALRQRNAPIRRVFSDTHGYSAFGMTLGKFEGIDLCPRLRSFKDRRLHIPRGRHIEVPEFLKNVCIADVSLETITKGWSQLCNIADAVAAGHISAVLACERYGSASRGEKAYKAGRDLGLLLRTLHQCDTLSIPEFRRETLRLLNHNERTHTLQRQIRRAGTTSRRGRRAEELSAQSGALALVTNLVIAWNTHALQATHTRWHAEFGKKIDRATLRHITPMGFEHINFNGVLIFPLDRFRNRLMPSNTSSVRPASG